MTEDAPVTVESLFDLAKMHADLLSQAAAIIGAQNCILRALLRDLVSTDPGLLERLAVLAQPDLEVAAPGVAESFTAILSGVAGEEAELGH